MPSSPKEYISPCYYEAYFGTLHSGLNTGVTTFQGSSLEGIHSSTFFPLSPGHPIGATGLGQCAEICWQVYNLQY